ncbi:MAG TPA: hypothetical protein VFO39_15890 [Candidatus Sulfotelmatobacter sp.]|nr:hypothetical protein [Candidatus Sulfotelmatobacter sp.]
MRKINPELLLLLALVVIAAILNFLVASQKMALVFYFLPTLYSAYHFGRRHATLTAFASVALVVLLAFVNPTMFTRHVTLPIDPRWFDLAVWGGVLMIAGYATGTLYERNQKTLREMEDGYEGMLVILQNFLANQKYSDARAYRISMCAMKIAETVGLDPGSVEDIRNAALLFSMKELGISDEVLRKAAQVSDIEQQQGWRKQSRLRAKATAMGNSLGRAIPLFVAERELRTSNTNAEDASFELQILLLAEEYEALTSGQGVAKMSPSQAQQDVLRRAKGHYDSMVVDAFAKSFGGQAAGAGA